MSNDPAVADARRKWRHRGIILLAIILALVWFLFLRAKPAGQPPPLAPVNAVPAN